MTVAAIRTGRPATVAAPVRVTLRLLSSFELFLGDRVVVLPPSVQRLIVFLTLQDRPLVRQYAAGTLWPETLEQRAGANLRSALWRVNRLGPRPIAVTGSTLRLAENVGVDLRQRTAQAHRLLDSDGTTPEHLDETAFRDDLLPDWYDDWLIMERERFHQLRLRALECICERLVKRGNFARALEAGLEAVAAEPLRESAHRALVKVHLAEGNKAEAVRQFQLYRRVLHDQLGLAPSLQIVDLLRA